MRALVLCEACKRHVKVSETRCPFCSAAVAGARNPGTANPRGLPGGRAALFLAGAALAAGCADEPEPDGLDDGQQGGADASMQRGPDAGAATDAGRDSGMLIAQPYGISIDPWRDASIVTPPDAGPSCPQLGNLPVPVYGVAVDSGTSINQCKDAGVDGGADAGKDAGADAGKDAGADAGKDAGMIALPPYGIPIDSGIIVAPAYGIAVDP